MSLSLGTHLGPYEIVASIGKGGMGEVYRARDPRIGRDVAVKVLPSAFARDPERLRRFEQEARATGMLNHPNILSIYDLGTHGGSPYLVAELLEGESLRERLGEGALSPRTAIDYGVQIARGLAAAHEKGITHRDLKPENVFVTRDGRIKILDFGLAKLTVRKETDSTATDLGAMSPGTEPGMVLGTVGYMSPEQVRGQPADHRSDIFAAGAILYEMLAGRRAFQGGSAVETMNVILKEDPPELSTSRPNLSPALERIVRHCLEKNREERFQSARDLAFDLEALSTVSAPAVPPVIMPPALWRRRAAIAVVAVAVVAALALAYSAGRRGASTQPPSFQQLTFRRGTIQAARFAPDGRTIIYGASWDGKPIELYSTRVESPESRPLGLAPAGILSISRSGEMAISLGCRFPAVFGIAGTLARLPLGGGAPREVLQAVEEADWSPDGKDFAVTRGFLTGKDRLEFPVGRVVYEAAGWIGQPRVSPRGDWVAFIDHGPQADDGTIAAVDRAGKKTILSERWNSAQGLAWTPDQKEIWFTGTRAGGARALHAVTAPGRGSPSLRLITRVTGSLTIQDIAPDGRVLMVHETARMGIRALPPGETQERDLSWLDWSLARDLSPDGKTVLFDETGEGSRGNYGVYLRTTDGAPAVRLGDGTARTLSPDGNWALSVTTNEPQLVLLPTRAGTPRPLARGKITTYLRSEWFPDGNRVLFVGAEAGRGQRTYVQDIQGGEPRPITPEGTAGFLLSSDGKLFLARDAQRKAYVWPVEGGTPRPIPGVDPRQVPVRWSADGRSVYLRSSGEVPVQVHRLELATGRQEFIREVVPSDAAGVKAISTIWLSAGAKSYVYSFVRVLSDLYLVEGLK